jgi:hypothetical protein
MTAMLETHVPPYSAATASGAQFSSLMYAGLPSYTPSFHYSYTVSIKIRQHFECKYLLNAVRLNKL